MSKTRLRKPYCGRRA